MNAKTSEIWDNYPQNLFSYLLIKNFMIHTYYYYWLASHKILFFSFIIDLKFYGYIFTVLYKVTR